MGLEQNCRIIKIDVVCINCDGTDFEVPKHDSQALRAFLFYKESDLNEVFRRKHPDIIVDDDNHETNHSGR